MSKTYKQLFHQPAKKTLNPKLWNTKTNTLLPEVEQAIRSRADDFVVRLGLRPSDIEDLRLVGGAASLNWSDASDIDATIMLRRELNLSRDEVRRLGISASNLTYRLHPTLNGYDLNLYLSSRNVGGIRPCGQSLYSLNKGEFIKGPTAISEKAPNAVAAKAAHFASLISECIEDESPEADGCAEKLLKRIKRFRLAGLKSAEGEASNQNLVYRVLTRSGFITTLKNKVEQLEKDWYRIQTPSLITNEEYRLLNKEDHELLNDLPLCLVRWQKRILMGSDPRRMVARVRPILQCFAD